MNELKKKLDRMYRQIQSESDRFIASDPIQIPKQFSHLQDIEISGFFAASLAWGQRTTIINKCAELMEWMDGQPHQFILEHSASDLKSLLNFKHRTFQADDLLYFIHFFKTFYQSHRSLEEAFISKEGFQSIRASLIQFNRIFTSDPNFPGRTAKHIASPERGSACKRLNMFLRWMVRKDKIDFGLWERIPQSALMCPLDVHVERQARKLGLLERKQLDWMAVEELSNRLRMLDARDPVKYDLVLFYSGAAAGIN